MKITELQTPVYVIDEARLVSNLEILHAVEKNSGCKILLAQKAFSAYALYPLIGRYISGTTASGLYEARLGFEEMGKENHVFSPAYKAEEVKELSRLCDHIVFNSFSQMEKFHKEAEKASIGIRVNPECSTQEGHAIYDPCAPYSRMGVVREQFPEILPDYVEGLHFHTLCEQDFDALEKTFYAFEEKFEKYLPGLKWINLGGGHHITRPDYDRTRLENLIQVIRNRYKLDVYLEPGEAIALNAGYLVSEVMDIVENGLSIAIIDASAACHMPDVLEMPYRPPLKESGEPQEKPFLYRLAARTCLAGDIIGDYSFDMPLRIGDKLYFEDMAIYSMVKNNTFNGMPLPSIALMHKDGTCEILRTFDYSDFKGRLS